MVPSCSALLSQSVPDETPRDPEKNVTGENVTGENATGENATGENATGENVTEKLPEFDQVTRSLVVKRLLTVAAFVAVFLAGLVARLVSPNVFE